MIRSMQDVVVRTNGLTRDFAGRRGVENLSLEVRAGRILALLGPNGAGKSTLMKLLAGHLMPTGGEATLWGESCWPTQHSLQRRMALVLDGLALPRGIRIRDYFRLRRAAVPGFDLGRAESLCAERDLSPKRTWNGLSKGQKRWVLLASALASRAELILLDEPADGLDPARRRHFYRLLREEANLNGTTVLIASHVLSDVERIADEVAILAEGRVLLHESLEDLREDVREVELSGSFQAADVPDDVEPLAWLPAGDSTMAWLRFDRTADVDVPLPGEIQRRSVGLENLYLAFAEEGEFIQGCGVEAGDVR